MSYGKSIPNNKIPKGGFFKSFLGIDNDHNHDCDCDEVVDSHKDDEKILRLYDTAMAFANGLYSSFSRENGKDDTAITIIRNAIRAEQAEVSDKLARGEKAKASKLIIDLNNNEYKSFEDLYKDVTGKELTTKKPEPKHVATEPTKKPESKPVVAEPATKTESKPATEKKSEPKPEKKTDAKVDKTDVKPDKKVDAKVEPDVKSEPTPKPAEKKPIPDKKEKKEVSGMDIVKNVKIKLANGKTVVMDLHTHTDKDGNIIYDDVIGNALGTEIYADEIEIADAAVNGETIAYLHLVSTVRYIAGKKIETVKVKI